MAYVDSLLATGERVVRRERQHWFVLAYNARWAILGLVLGFILLVLRAAGSLPSGFFGDLLLWLTVALVLGGGIWGLWSILRWQNQEFVVTTRRIIVAEGVINKKATDSSLEKINDAVLTQSFVGRIFGFGDLDVLTASEAGIERLRMLVDATGFKKSMLDAKYALERELAQQIEVPEAVGPTPMTYAPPPAHATAPAAAPAPTPSVAAPTPAMPTPPMSSDEVTETLGRLAALRDSGAISAEDYEAKKRELLARL